LHVPDLVSVLEGEAIYVIREAAAELDRLALLFSGGKDSAVLLHLAAKAFHPRPIPFPLLHIDTGHNFPEVLEFRDWAASHYGADLLVFRVEDSIRRGTAQEDPSGSRNRAQAVTLKEAIAELGLEGLFGGARREEEKARAKERVFSIRRGDGGWDPENQRPEVFDLFNTLLGEGEHFRIFPLSNWTELDVWEYVLREDIRLCPIYFAHERDVYLKDGRFLMPVAPFGPAPSEAATRMWVRFRTVGDMLCTAAVPSRAATPKEVLEELKAVKVSERGQTRADDAFSEAAMEERKRAGYF
jgi:sulfate adenylyltransferase subunit 2